MCDLIISLHLHGGNIETIIQYHNKLSINTCSMNLKVNSNFNIVCNVVEMILLLTLTMDCGHVTSDRKYSNFWILDMETCLFCFPAFTAPLTLGNKIKQPFESTQFKVAPGKRVQSIFIFSCVETFCKAMLFWGDLDHENKQTKNKYWWSWWQFLSWLRNCS